MQTCDAVGMSVGLMMALEMASAMIALEAVKHWI
jgi:hypothetical protein